MRIEIATQSFNSRRYSKPWIAKIVNGKYNFTGRWIGEIDRGNGTAGACIIDANPGDVIAQGIKDNRGNGSENNFYRVEENGTLTKITKLEAMR